MPAETLKPQIILSHNGIPFNALKEPFTEETFQDYCNKVLTYIKNNRISTAFFLLGDYIGKNGSNREKQYFNYLDPDKGTNGIPWIVDHFLAKLPLDVEAGFFIAPDPKYAWNLYDQNNFDGNEKIGNGSKGQPLDNMAQAFRLAKTLNEQSKQIGGAQFTRMEFDHEGGGDYQNDTPYGGQAGEPIGVGYTKWLWNQSMPGSVIHDHQEASSDKFDGHYQFGWINYAVDAWQQNSGGSLDAYAENYWFGELRDEPGQFEAPYSNEKNTPGKWLNLPTISEVLGKDPSKAIPITGGSNTYNWQVLNEKGEEVISPQAIDTTYRYYKDYPQALVEMFDDKRYQENGAKTYPLSSKYYAPVDPKQKSGSESPQGGIPTFSIEFLSSTNNSNAKDPQSLIGLYTNNDAPNSHGGTFDGLSSLAHGDWIKFLNGAAERIAAANAIKPEDVKLQIYEQQFLPLDWINQSVANPWTNDRIVGDNSDNVIHGIDGNDQYTGKEGADNFHLHKGNIVITDFNPKEGDIITPLKGDYSLSTSDNNTHLIHESGAMATILNANPWDVKYLTLWH